MKRAILTGILLVLSVWPIGSEEANTEGLRIEDIKSFKGKTAYANTPAACFAFKLFNDGPHTYLKVQLTIIFLDGSGKPFFETRLFFINADGIIKQDEPLRPNYSKVQKPGCITEGQGIDLQRWQEGEIRIVISDTLTEAEKAAKEAEAKRKEDELKRKREELQKRMEELRNK